MASRIIGIDLDGVLANFNKAYRERLITVSGRNLIPEGEEPPCWHYAPHYGYTRSEDDATWRSIRNDAYFWQGLSALPHAHAFLKELAAAVDAQDEVYFITSRPGLSAKGQSERWLIIHGWTGESTVLIARGDKGLFATGLGLTHFVDDKPENCYSVRDASPTTETFLLSCRYNAAAHDECWSRGIIVIPTITHFLESLSCRV